METLKTTHLRYRGMVGTGGIGWGSFFLLHGNATLGREESRSGRFLDRRDYCKLHIISHYVKRLLGRKFPVYPVGKVGGDPEGERLLGEMREAGLDLRFVERLAGARTLYSFCFVYPDGAGGNLTLDDSASSRVDAQSVRAAEAAAAELGESGIALAAPEVPLEARVELLSMATRRGLFRAAAFTRGEMEAVRSSGLLDRVDLLAANLEEAVAAAGLEAAAARVTGEPELGRLVQGVVGEMSRRHPRLALSLTAGVRGSWTWDGERVIHDPAVPVRVETTAGAGDAHLAGVLAGLAAGLPLAEAQELGTLAGSASVTSPHTIHPALDAALLRGLCGARPATSPAVRALLGIGPNP
jgi:sugar/nucleoside kinase (ribokinase family)